MKLATFSLQGVSVALFNLLGEGRDSLVGSSVSIFNKSLGRVDSLLNLLLGLVAATCEGDSHNG